MDFGERRSGHYAQVTAVCEFRPAIFATADMTTQRRQIDEMLSSQGWQVVERQVKPSWWLAEVWVLESTQTPVGSRAYLSFLIDPQNLSLRNTDAQVWAVSVSTEGPAITPMGSDVVPLLRDWEKRGRGELLEKIRALRAPSEG